jgi:hypothetical protein
LVNQGASYWLENVNSSSNINLIIVLAQVCATQNLVKAIYFFFTFHYEAFAGPLQGLGDKFFPETEGAIEQQVDV